MEEKVLNAIKEPLLKEKIMVDDIFLEKENGSVALTIVVDAEVVDMNMCVKATEIINPIIDELDLDLESYELRVAGKVSEENEC